MFGLFVAKPGLELPVRSHFLTQVRHHLTGDTLNLVVVPFSGTWVEVDPMESLAPGVVREVETGHLYYINQLVGEFDAEPGFSAQSGVWYTRLEADITQDLPNGFWPLHTRDRQGWLYRYKEPRFERVSVAGVQLNTARDDLYDDRPSRRH